MVYKPKLWQIVLSSLFIIILTIGMKLEKDKDSKNTITDLIEPLNLVSGETDSTLISDLFYADNYNNIKIASNPFVKMRFNYDKTKFIFIPSENFEGITLIDFKLGDNIYEMPVRVSQEQYVTFSFKPVKNYNKVFLFGSFNSWDRSSLEMKNNNGTYQIKIPLEPGRYQYKFFADGNELMDPDNPEKISNGMGDYNSVVTVEPKHKAQPFLSIWNGKIDQDNSTFSFIYSNGNGVGKCYEEYNCTSR